MNILNELLQIINEEDELQKKLQDLFSQADSDGNLKPYVKDEILEIRPAEADEEVNVTFPGETLGKHKAQEGDYIARSESNSNQVKIVSSEDLENYELLDANRKPDAEGYQAYREKGQILAFEYIEHETLKLKDEQGKIVNVKYGDYLGYPIDDDSTLIHLDKSHFEKAYRLAD